MPWPRSVAAPAVGVRRAPTLCIALLIAILAPAPATAQFQRTPKPAEPAAGQQDAPPEAPSREHEEPPPEDSGFVIRTDVRLVRAEVQVTQKNRIVSSLTRDDFILRDEGVLTEIAQFGLEDDPLDVMMLLDVSGSMTAYLYEVSRAAGAALRQLQPSDRLGVMIFSKEAKVLSELSAPREEALATLRSLARQPGMGAGTAINASILSAVDAIKADAAQGRYDPKRRRAILILTDNWGLNYRVPDRVVLRVLHEQNISLHAIVVGRVQRPKGNWGEIARDGLEDEIDFSPANVFQLATDTGGDIFTDLRGDQGLAGILNRIRNRFSLYFKPAPDARPGAFRRITVSLRPETARAHRGAEVRARAGYYTD